MTIDTTFDTIKRGAEAVGIDATTLLEFWEKGEVETCRHGLDEMLADVDTLRRQIERAKRDLPA